MNTNKELTYRELKAAIKEETRKANARIAGVSGDTRGDFDRQLQHFKKMGLVSKRTGGLAMNFKVAEGRTKEGKIHYRTKTKIELKKQLRELQYFNKWRSAESRATRSKKDIEKYRQFKMYKNQYTGEQPFKNFKYNEWRDLVEIFGTAEDLVKEFGYENIKEFYAESKGKKQKVDFVTAMQETKRKFEADYQAGNISDKEDPQALLMEMLRKKVLGK